MKTEEDFRFFLSEIFSSDSKEGGVFLELMRIASHIYEFQKILSLFNGPSEENEEEYLAFLIKNESTRIFLFNYLAAQTREALKFYREFYNLPIYHEIKVKTPALKKNFERLENLAQEYQSNKGIIFDNLKPLRDIIFHYDKKNAENWLHRMMELEKERKPHFQIVNFQKKQYGPAMDYDQSIFFENIAWPKNVPFHHLIIEIVQIQQDFDEIIKATIYYKLINSGVENNRPNDWHLPYWHGYNKNLKK